MSSTNFKKLLLDKLNIVLRPLRFKKHQNIFSFSNRDLTYYIILQTRGDSTSSELSATVNIEIASSKLSHLDDMSLPNYLQRHFVKNIGEYSGRKEEMWWSIENEQAATTAQKEIVDIISSKVLPEIGELKSTNDLASLWKKHISPGLTKYQSREFLSLLQMG